MTGRHLQILGTLLAQPTCPFHEEAVVEQVARWAAEAGVSMARDGAGNVLLHYRRGRRATKWAFTAHMDHPGFLARRQRGRSVWADFRGGVRAEYRLGSRVRLFAPGGEVAGAIRSHRPIPDTPWWSCRLELDAPREVPPGTIGMWDFPACRVRGRRLSARCCDDVAGTAAVVCAIDALAAKKVPADVLGLLTRAEEAGFVGALAACRGGSIPAGTLVVGVECSKAQPGGPLGSGAVIRVGDSRRTFDPSLTAVISAVADDLAKSRKPLRYTRLLMPGGVCESTVYCAFGHRAAALALPLGNYHNMGPRGRIAPERIDLDDFESLVALLAALPADGRTPADIDRQLRARLGRQLAQRRGLLSE